VEGVGVSDLRELLTPWPDDTPAFDVVKAPFPWFGGKSRAAAMIWRRLGPVRNYIEPFAGSLAVMLRSPYPPARYETVNDLDNYVANLWRALQYDPEAVAFHADWPVNEACLTARHRWLMVKARKDKFRKRMLADPFYYDAMIAGWWVWGQSCWIGAGWCDQKSEWHGYATGDNRGRGMQGEPKQPRVNRPNGCHAGLGIRPGLTEQKCITATPEFMATSNRGVVKQQLPRGAQLPELCTAGNPEVKRPHLMGDKGTVGVKLPHIGTTQGTQGPGNPERADAVKVGRPHLQRPYQVSAPPNKRPHLKRGCKGTAAFWCQNEALLDWMLVLQARLRYVRVCCGDWKRVTGRAVLEAASPCAVMLDPPYSTEAGRDMGIYSHGCGNVAHEVFDWCVANGANPDLRIALCGYAGEGHEALEGMGWTVEAWKASGGYGRLHGDAPGKSLENRHKERIWFSPHCLRKVVLAEWWAAENEKG
jgi:hypothetical protein